MRLSTAGRIGLILSFVLALVVSVFVGYAFASDRASYNLIPDNTSIAGVDVSGMTAEEATKAVEDYTASRQSASVNFSLVDPETQTAYPVSLTATVKYDVATAVETAIARRQDTAALSRITSEITNAPVEQVDIPLEEQSLAVDSTPIREAVESLAPAYVSDPVDASRTFNNDNTVTITPETYGTAIDVDATVAAAETTLSQAVATSPSLANLASRAISSPLTMTYTAPAVTVDSFPYAIIIDYAEFTLYVFDGDQVIWQCYIGYGRGWEDGVNYDSPTGLHYIDYFDPSPTWSNPDPTGWGAGYKDFYAGGEEGNPLGSRAMKVSDASMVFIHGVSDYGIVGQRLSHGCINVYDPEVIDLYNLLYDNAVEHDSLSVGGAGEPIYVYFHNYPG